MKQWEIPTLMTRNCVLSRIKAQMKTLVLTFNLHSSVKGTVFLAGTTIFPLQSGHIVHKLLVVIFQPGRVDMQHYVITLGKTLLTRPYDASFHMTMCQVEMDDMALK